MRIKGIIFDVNGTLVDIKTDEEYRKIYRFISRFLSYQGIMVHWEEVKAEYFAILRAQRHANPEEHPEYDVLEVWREFLRRRRLDGPDVSHAKREMLPVFLAELYRGISRTRLRLYPEVREVLDELRPRFRLAVLSDAQKAWAVPELRTVGIETYFDPIVISGDFGFRKPDRRLFEITLSRLGLAPWEVLYVGNDMYRDVYGPRQLGIPTVFFSSNQGRKHMDGVEPDYVIHHFGQLRDAVHFFEHRN